MSGVRGVARKSNGYFKLNHHLAPSPPMPRVLATTAKTLVMIAIWLAIAWGLGRLSAIDDSLGTRLPPWVRLPGTIAVALGGAGVLACGVLLADRGGIGSLRGDEWFMPDTFIATGPFRFVRNPMSLAGVVLFLGLALWHRSSL